MNRLSMDPQTGIHPQRGSVSILAVGTHHKTGTKWLRGALSRISRRCNIPLSFYPSASDDWVEKITARPALVFSGSSRFPEKLRHDPEAHVVRMIRDPRDMLLSAMRYHCKATDRHEKFLYRPRPNLAGLSYQEHLNQLPSFEDQLLFEMDNHHAQTLNQLLTAKLDGTHTTQWKYEDLIVDTECIRFREAFQTLKVDDGTVNRAVRIFKRNSLFGRADAPEIAEHSHVFSGKPQQWKTQLPLAVAKRYLEVNGETLVKLGYESGSDWLGQIQS